jgi:hypothetical protein
MNFSLKTVLLQTTVLILSTTILTYAQVREGSSAGVIFSSVTTTNSWKGAPDGTSFKDVTGTAKKWSIPLQYSSYGEGTYIDFSTGLAGWILLNLLGDGYDTPNTPAFKENDKFSFGDINIASLRFATDLLELGILTGGQVGAGYLGTGLAEKKDRGNVFEADSYFSYGANAGITFNIGHQFVQALFLYDWVSMGEDRKGNTWTAELEYFPFAASDRYSLIHFKAFGKSTTINYPEKIAGPDYEYSDFQIGIGLILDNIPLF